MSVFEDESGDFWQEKEDNETLDDVGSDEDGFPTEEGEEED